MSAGKLKRESWRPAPSSSWRPASTPQQTARPSASSSTAGPSARSPSPSRQPDPPSRRGRSPDRRATYSPDRSGSRWEEGGDRSRTGERGERSRRDSPGRGRSRSRSRSRSRDRFRRDDSRDRGGREKDRPGGRAASPGGKKDGERSWAAWNNITKTDMPRVDRRSPPRRVERPRDRSRERDRPRERSRSRERGWQGRNLDRGDHGRDGRDRDGDRPQGKKVDDKGGDRSWSAWRAKVDATSAPERRREDDRRRERDRSEPRDKADTYRPLPPPRSPSPRRVSKQRSPSPARRAVVNTRRASPDYGMGKRAGSPGGVGDVSGGRRGSRSPSPRRLARSSSRTDRKRAPPSPPLPSSKRLRDLSPSRSQASTRLRSPSPPRHAVRSGRSPSPRHLATNRPRSSSPIRHSPSPPRRAPSPSQNNRPSLASQFQLFRNEAQVWRRNGDDSLPRSGSGSSSAFQPAERYIPAQSSPEKSLNGSDPVRIDLGASTPVSPIKGGWKTVAVASSIPVKSQGVQQFFASPGRSSPGLNGTNAGMDVDPPKADAATEEQTVPPYLQAAFDMWSSQPTPPHLPDHLVHYLGRQPSASELKQVLVLLETRRDSSRNQVQWRNLDREVMDLEDRIRLGSPRGDANGSTPRRDLNSIPIPVSRNRWQPSKAIERPVSPPRSASTPSKKEVEHDSAPRTEPSPAEVEPEPMVVPASSSGETYARLECVGEGTYGKVYKARNQETGSLVALKRIRMEGEKDGFPVTAMREIKLLQGLRHPNVLRLWEMMVSKGSVYMVLEYMDHDLTGLLFHPEIAFSPANLKSLCHQMLDGLAYLHTNSILHRDMKGSNILLNARGELKLADFGLARIYNRKRAADYTNRVITLWYRPVELLLGETVYGPAVDLWSAGCIMLELFTTKPVFQGQDEIHQLEVIYAMLGTPVEEDWPQLKELPWYELVKPKESIPSKFRGAFAKWLSPAALDLAEGLLALNPAKRLTAEEAMQTAYFTTEDPAMEKPSQLAGCGEHHELSTKLERQKRRMEGK